jgi:hypothetical protein
MSRVIALMGEAERRALIDGSGDPAAPLASVHDFQVLDQVVWNALLLLQVARGQAEVAAVLLQRARGSMRATGLLLASQPRPHYIRARVTVERNLAVDYLRDGHALAIASRWSLDTAMRAIPLHFDANAFYAALDGGDEDGDGDEDGGGEGHPAAAADTSDDDEEDDDGGDSADDSSDDDDDEEEDDGGDDAADDSSDEEEDGGTDTDGDSCVED